MNPSSTEDVLELIDSYTVTAALGAALELGLFWLLREQALAAEDLSQRLGIPLSRCRYWLQLLGSTGLIDESSGRYAPSRTARTAILGAYSRETWSLLAQESREQFPAVLDLALHVHQPGSTWAVQGLMRPDYYAQLVQDPERARRFTRMLYELHQPLADQLALFLDMRGVDRLMDLGGGSGVVSLALLRRHPHLTAMVLDTANVCAAGREIAAENPETGRIQYEPIDIVRDALPVGFDAVLECDVGVHNQALFSKTLSALNPDGRLIIVDQFAPVAGVAPPSRLNWAFADSLANPDSVYPTVKEIQDMLALAGYHQLSCRLLPRGDAMRWSEGWQVIEARK